MATVKLVDAPAEQPSESNVFTGKWVYKISNMNAVAKSKIPPYSTINKVTASCELKRDGLSLSTSNASVRFYWANNSWVKVGNSILDQSGSISTSYKSFSADITAYFHSGNEKAGQVIDISGATGFAFVADGVVLRNFHIRNAYITVDYTPPSYGLDVQGWVDGREIGTIQNYGTFDMYINGVDTSANGKIYDYWQHHDYGTKYEVKNVVANTGWHYDGPHSSSAPLSGTLTGETKIVLAFSKLRYTVSLSANAGGTVYGGDTYDYGTEVIIEANPDYLYRFVRWSDGNTDNPRTIVVTEDITLSAEFESTEAICSLVRSEKGIVFGQGWTSEVITSITTTKGDILIINARPKDGYRFVSWWDGNTENPREYTVTQDVTLSAVWEEILPDKPPVFTHASMTYGGRQISETNKVPAGQTFILAVGAE
ncbi:MAG: hypothetical protein NC110_06120 [Ruminococcus sp.]|nr:hypothetical protein [Ruminococcus sp.]